MHLARSLAGLERSRPDRIEDHCLQHCAPLGALTSWLRGQCVSSQPAPAAASWASLQQPLSGAPRGAPYGTDEAQLGQLAPARHWTTAKDTCDRTSLASTRPSTAYATQLLQPRSVFLPDSTEFKEHLPRSPCNSTTMLKPPCSFLFPCCCPVRPGGTRLRPLAPCSSASPSASPSSPDAPTTPRGDTAQRVPRAEPAAAAAAAAEADGGCECGRRGAGEAEAGPWVPPANTWSAAPNLAPDIEDLHAAACQAGRGTYADPVTGFTVRTGGLDSAQGRVG